jgi:RNA-splicing ligase RtcB
LDKIIYELIPHGFDIHKHPSDYDFSDLRCANNPDIDLYRGQCSLGTLGGGNHFIEIDKDDNGTLYLIIHSGSRNIGLSVATHYQKIAENTNRCQENRELSFLTNNDFSNYIHDVKIMQQFASDNRKRMAEIILATMGWIAKNQFETIHNYIDTDKMILRKGAIRAEKDERVLIPINMKDGCIIARGHGNPDWNFSAPHGAGRVLSRTQAKKQLSMNTFQNSMKGIYTTSVKKSTLDESPEAYKSISDILSWINDSVTVEKIIKPIYNFKA